MRSKQRLTLLEGEIVSCTRCPRLVEWRKRVAETRTRRFSQEEYWGKPVPGFGDPNARLLVVGLAPAAHGANRTGRMFTGDRSGEWLYRALHQAGFANQRTSLHPGDGLRLIDCYVTAALRCAPPGNKPIRSERENCRPFLVSEASLLTGVKVVVALGRIAFETAKEIFPSGGEKQSSFRFGHGAQSVRGNITLIASYHPSQQNTFTRRLSEPMFESIFFAAREVLSR